MYAINQESEPPVEPSEKVYFEFLGRMPGDVTGDGKVNNRDLGILQQYLNEYDVELKYGQEL